MAHLSERGWIWHEVQLHASAIGGSGSRHGSSRPQAMDDDIAVQKLRTGEGAAGNDFADRFVGCDVLVNQMRESGQIDALGDKRDTRIAWNADESVDRFWRQIEREGDDRDPDVLQQLSHPGKAASQG